jgi:Glyoxalase/Bleomycin resistance protein/Dioxygenase superfamily
MGIERIEELIYGVDDLERCARFYEDYGLEPLESDDDHAVLRTLVNQRVKLYKEADPSLPVAPQPAADNGAMFREVVWGVDTQEALAAIVANLSADREVWQSDDGTFHTLDESGYTIGFRVSEKIDVAFEAKSINVTGDVPRWNKELEGYGRAHPIRACHIALDIRKVDRERAEAFYIERLNFRPVDIVKPLGVFLQAEGDWDQHNFLLMHRSDAYGINHVAFECRDFDEVIEGGNYMIAKGWDEARYLGRHQIGSNIYRFFYTPSGGRCEYVCDMTRVDENYETPRVWEEAAPHHIWLLKPPKNDGQPKMDDVVQGAKLSS